MLTLSQWLTRLDKSRNGKGVRYKIPLTSGKPLYYIASRFLSAGKTSETWAPLVQNTACVTAWNCANSVIAFVAAALAAYNTVSLVAIAATVVMLKTIYRSWKRAKLLWEKEKMLQLLFIQTVIDTLAHGTTTRNMATESLYARTGPGKLKMNSYVRVFKLVGFNGNAVSLFQKRGRIMDRAEVL